jgi:hypothetical protein
MTEVARPEDNATDAAAPAPAADPIDESLREFETATARPASQSADQPVEQPSPATAAPPAKDDLDKLLDELSQPAAPWAAQFAPGTLEAVQQQQEQQFNAVQSENFQLRQHIQRATDQADLDKLTAELQSRLPPHLPEDFAVTQLKSMAVDRPELVLAFDYRSADRRAVDQELRRVEQVYNQTTDPAQRAQLQQYGNRLGIALNSREILNRAVREVVKRGRAHHPIDEIATADHDAVAASVRGASGKAQPEPPPNLGQMSDKQLREYTRTNFGF